MCLQLRKWHHNCWPKQPIILCDWLLGKKTAIFIGITICKGDHFVWREGWPLVSLADRLNNGSFSVGPYESLAQVCCPCNSPSHVEKQVSFFMILHWSSSRFYQLSKWLYFSYSITSLLCFGALFLGYFQSLFCFYVCCFGVLQLVENFCMPTVWTVC